MGLNEPMRVFLKRELNRNWPFLVGFGITFTIVTKMSLGLTEEDAKNSPFVQRHGKRRILRFCLQLAANPEGIEQKLAISGRFWHYIHHRNQDVPWLDRGGCKKFPFRAAPWKELRAQKPTWETGSSFSLKNKAVQKQGRLPKSDPLGVKLDMNDDLEDLIDEESLLSEEDSKRSSLPSTNDYEVSTKRKACKNCTCGRAELEEKQTKLA